MLSFIEVNGSQIGKGIFSPRPPRPPKAALPQTSSDGKYNTFGLWIYMLLWVFKYVNPNF